ncbi:hypothetical protein BDN70DRAFT_172430 [Pholiota conissans]|uniref:Uncharacterized protein n=1 Tax=Pholiota conissans TaxID=109636 RepID=A0A9P5YXN3_9AGAR|nr:hypothetical protein BDN70DRAFT_172430 [Pholiota conissans]
MLRGMDRQGLDFISRISMLVLLPIIVAVSVQGYLPPSPLSTSSTMVQIDTRRVPISHLADLSAPHQLNPCSSNEAVYAAGYANSSFPISNSEEIHTMAPQYWATRTLDLTR